VQAGPPSVVAVTRFARGLGAARSGDAAAARAEVVELEKLVAALKTSDAYWAHVVGAQQKAVSAWLAHVEGKHEDAVRLAREAADAEDEVEKHAVTPGPLLPARELLGDILLVHGKPADALVAYETALKREPNRLRIYQGAAAAAKAAGKPDVARRYYGEVVRLVDPASRRPALAEAKSFLAAR
jgi:tetratricopeptide (TPR) repeat protein